MSNIDCCKVCDKQKSLRKCELCRSACCDRCYRSHKSENICKLIKAYKDQIDCMCVAGVNGVFPNFCVNCSEPIDEACCNTCHKKSISVKDAVPELLADMKKGRLWLVKKKSEAKKYVEALPEYSNENTAIRNKMKAMMKENKANSLCLENLQHKLEHDLTTLEQKCDDIGDFRMQAEHIINEFSSLEKIKSLFVFLPIWLNIKRKIDNWKTTLLWTPFILPGGIRFNYENQEVSNLEPYLEILNGEKNCHDPDLPKHDDEIDKLTDSFTEVVKINDQLRKSPDKCEHLQHMLDVLYKLSVDSLKLSFEEETAILSKTFGGTDTDKMTEKAEQTAMKITELRRECIEKEDIIKELQRKRDEQQPNENEIQELKLNNQSLMKENEELENEIQNLKREHKESYESYENALREHAEDNTRLTKAEQETYDIVKKLRDEKEKNNLEIENLKDEVKSLKLGQTENDKEQKIQELQLMNESITKKNKELEKDILHLKRENTELHNKLIIRTV